MSKPLIQRKGSNQIFQARLNSKTVPIADEKVRRQKRRREDADGVNDQRKRISTAEEEVRDHQKQIKLEYEEKSKPAPGCSFWGNQEEKALKIKKESKEEPANERFKFVMEVIQPALNHIKGDVRTSLKVIEAINVLEEEAQGRLREQIKLEQEASFATKQEYFEDDKNSF